MDNGELLQQVVSLMSEQTNTISKILDSTKEELRQEINQSETRIAIQIENEIATQSAKLACAVVHRKLGIAI